MKLKRKSIVICSFVLLDCLFAGLAVSGQAMGKTVDTVAHINASKNSSIVEKISNIEDEVTDDIGSEAVSQEDLLIAQEIIMNEQNNSIIGNQNKNDVIVENTSALNLARAIVINEKNESEAQKKAEIEQAELIASLEKNGGSATGNAISKYSLNFNGKGYVFGGSWDGSLNYTPTDCSGFVQGLYAHYGIKLPRTARKQAQLGKEVSIKNIQPGDLVFYSSGGTTITHVAMYIGDGKIIHARTPAHGVGINSVFIMRRLSIRRIIN